MYMDSDTMAVGDVSPMLTEANMSLAAVHDWEDGQIREHFNCGVISFIPSVAEFKRLDGARRTKRDYRLGMAEQGLFNVVYATNTSYQEFPFEYNGNLAAELQNRTYWDLHRKSLRVIHYTWLKPFLTTINSNREINNCRGDCAILADTLKEWWNMYDEMKAVS